MPLANISESEKEYLIKIELPDVKKEDVKFAVADGIIIISGERKLEREDQGENAIRIASVYGAFARSFVLPDYADANGIHAESKDGVLRIHVPKTKRSEPWRSRFIESARGPLVLFGSAGTRFSALLELTGIGGDFEPRAAIRKESE
jgi:HSP20 family molecular chaperone IbpA